MEQQKMSGKISIHAPRTGSDSFLLSCLGFNVPFQSTLPARGATKAFFRTLLLVSLFQSTLPARGATM